MATIKQMRGEGRNETIILQNKNNYNIGLYHTNCTRFIEGNMYMLMYVCN